MSTISAITGSVPAVGTQPAPAVDSAKGNQHEHAVAKTPPAEHDSVHLSAAAQAKALKQQGKTPAQIAVAMNTDVKTVDGYLGIAASTTTTSPAVPAAAKAPAAPAATKADVKA